MPTAGMRPVRSPTEAKAPSGRSATGTTVRPSAVSGSASFKWAAAITMVSVGAGMACWGWVFR
ncbi:hypothetical protein D3C86_2247980 [compost metagenome]